VELPLVELLSHPHRCACACHDTLTLDERTAGVRALYRFDDALRGWGYEPIYTPNADALFREAKRRNDRTYRGIAVHDEACVYRRLVGFAVHELIHALNGDPTQANYGIPFGLPYGVPEGLPEGAEAEYLAPHNLAEARAWVGVRRFAEALFGIEWELRTARDVGTYGFVGGNAVVDVPAGFRQVPHVDRQIQTQRYYALARRLEEEARAGLTDELIADWCARVGAAERVGAARRGRPWPDARELARIPPQKVGRNELCSCGSGKKWKRCCGAAA
jgi:hypothetical protein